MNICVCEKEENGSATAEYIKQYFEEKNAEYILHRFSSGELLLKSDVIAGVEIFFIHVALEETDGIHVIKELKEKYNKKHFVLIAETYDYIDMAMDLGVTRYVIEPVQKEALYAALDKSIEQINKNILKLKSTEGYIYYLHIDDIVCAESKGRKTLITTTDGIIKINQSIKEMKEQLTSPDFISPHYSFLVNKNYIAFIDAKDIFLKVDYHFVRVPIAAKRRTGIRKSLMC